MSAHAGAKKTRFRFTEEERLKLISEVCKAVREEVQTTEEVLWRNVHSNLCRDHPRFGGCSLRLLKDHTLDQVAKFKKCEAEGSDAARERLKSKWGDKMKQLVTVWCNYEYLVELEATVKASKAGRPRKEITGQKPSADLAHELRESSLQSISLSHDCFEENTGPLYMETDKGADDADNSNDDETTFHDSIADAEDQTACASSMLLNQPTSLSDGSMVNETQLCSESLKQAIPNFANNLKINQSDKGVWLYLAEKARMENQLKTRMHTESMELQREQLAYKKAKLEFEQEKWKAEMEERKMQYQMNEATTALLQKILNSGLLNNITRKVCSKCDYKNNSI